MVKNNRHLLGAILILLAAYWLRMMDLHTLPAGLHRDDAVNVWRVWRYASGLGMPLYFETSPEPFDAMLRAPLMWIAGPSPFAQRLFSVWLGVLGVAAVMTAARILYRNHAHRSIIALTAGITLAVNPSAVIVNRQILRANWLPLWAMLAVAALALGWQTGKQRYYLAAGILTGLTAMFYLAGLIMLPAVVIILGLNWLLDRQTGPGWRNLGWLGLGTGLTMLPWLTLYLRISGWLAERTSQIEQTIDPAEGSTTILADLGLSISRLWVGNGEVFQTRAGMIYGTLDAGMLNLFLLALLLIGLIASVIRGQKTGRMVPVVIGVLALLPAALTNHPQNQLRLIMLWGAVALVAGLGAGTAASILAKILGDRQATLQRILIVILLIVLTGSTLHTATNVQHHFREQPAIHEAPEHWFSLKNTFQLGYNELAQTIAASEGPVYVPVTLITDSIGSTWINIAMNADVNSYAGEPLPAGQVILPNPDSPLDIPALGLELQYILVDPTQETITVLPPLGIDTAQALQAQVYAEGAAITGQEGWLLGHWLPITNTSNPFASVTLPPGDEILGVFDDNLELVALETERALTPGLPFPVTMYWRLREPTTTDYFAFVQPFAYTEENQGTIDSWLLRWLYPTVQWQPGEIVPVTIWVNFFEDAPPGAYRYLVWIYKQPNDVRVSAADPTGTIQENDWLLVGRSVVPLPPFVEPPPTATQIDAAIGDTITLSHVGVANETLNPGDVLDLTLYWQATGQPTNDYTIFLHVLDANGNLIAQQDTAPLDGQYPTGHWHSGERVTTYHQLAIPPDAQGPYTIYGGMYAWPSLERLPVTVGGEIMPDGRALLWAEAARD